MWQKFSESARRTIFYAQEEAERFGSSQVSLDHLLLGITRDSNNVASVILERLGVPPDVLRSQILLHEATLRQARVEPAQPRQDMHLSAEAQQSINFAYEASKSLSNTYIGTEHLLMGIVRQGQGPAVQVLAQLNVDGEAVRQQILAYEEPGQETG